MRKHRSQFSDELSRILINARKVGLASPFGAINTLFKTGRDLGLSDTAVVDYVLKELKR